jgi:hypothetical protein
MNSGSPVLGGNVGFTSVTNPSTGVYCISPVFRDAANSLVLPVFGPVNGGIGATIVASGACPATAYQVETYNQGNGNVAAPAQGQGFTIAIP